MAYRCWVGVVLWLAASAAGATHDFAVRLHQGKLKVSELNAPISRELHLPNFPTREEVDLSGAEAADALCALNACLWHGCSIELRGQDVVVHLSEPTPESLCRRASRMTRILTAEKGPGATAAQARRWGLGLPQRLDPTKPLVLLVHGLDADRGDCAPLGELLTAAGWQTACFSYPGDQPIDDSAALLARSLLDLRRRFPNLRIEIVAHSMGSLVARDYVEGPDYTGGVDRLIMVAPPNRGSSWAHLRSALSVQRNYALRRDEPDWRWSWVITEGMGEAGTDLLPGSDFLCQLNTRPRRRGVQYTIIAGNRSAVAEVEADLLESLGSCVPPFARSWWGLGRCYRDLHSAADRMRNADADTDGVVSLGSATLDGVSDYVILPADHRSLYEPDGAKPPAAWPVVLDRLRR